MIIWNTAAGFLSNVTKGEPFQFALSCSNAETFQVIAGTLPLGLTLTGPQNQEQLPYPSIWGATSTDCVTGTFTFTIRAFDSLGNISDRAFSLVVLDNEPVYLFPNANLGIFPDGNWMYTSVAPLTATPNWPTNIQIVSGEIPYQLSLNSNTGEITGYISPAVLYNSPLNQPNAESGGPDLALSANTRTYSFAIQYDSYNTSDYYLTVERQDLYNTGNCNVSLPVYHDPIFLDATFDNTTCSSAFANLDLGLIDGDSILYQFKTEDFEDNTLGYVLINGDVLPGNVTINPTTGWLSGYINRDLSLPTPYEFQVLVYKSANVFANLNYQTLAFCTLTIDNPTDNSIIWNSPYVIGNLYPGIPSSLNVAASIIEPFSTPAIVPATANCSLKLVSANILNGGNAFSIGSVFTVPGGININDANIIVANVSPTGTITEITIDQTVIQQYTKLPNSFTAIWTNESGNANALNAIFSLNFGVDTVNIIKQGNFYDTATCGFGSAGESNSAIATPYIFNGTISGVVVNETGNNYQTIPSVTILAKSFISPTNPINYSLSSGSIPAGCNLLSNGLIVGIPSSQYFTLDHDTILDKNQTVFDTTYEFTVTASIGQNSNVEHIETDLIGDNVVYQDFQTLIQIDKTFSLNLQTNINNNVSDAPKTNLSLEFLLDNTDMQTLFKPILNESIVSNDDIFRQADFYFGIAPHVRMLLAYGISPELSSTVQESISKYFHNKKYTFNYLQWAQSTSEGYEVIYVVPLDEFTNKNYETFQGSITYNTPTGPKEAFPATLPNMITQLNTHLNGFDYNFLPSWMRDIQPNGEILGFVPVIPLLYVKPGTGKKIMFYLQQYYNNIGPNLNTIDAVTDRLVWNTGYSQNWDSCPLVTLSAQNITVQISGVTTSGTNAIYSILSGNGFANTVPIGTIFVIEGMTNTINNGKVTVTNSGIGTFTIVNASAITESDSAGYGYSLNINANSNFIINPAVPLTFTPNLTPRTYEFFGNVTVNLPYNMTSISNVVTIINDLNINGIQSVIGPDSEIQIQNIYGCPFILFDGSNTPLQNLGLLPSGNVYANINVAVVAGWWTSEITEFDQVSVETDLETESSLDLTTENCMVIITQGSTYFSDISSFFDTSDVFLNDDDGAIYIKFKDSSFINYPVVGV